METCHQYNTNEGTVPPKCVPAGFCLRALAANLDFWIKSMLVLWLLRFDLLYNLFGFVANFEGFEDPFDILGLLFLFLFTLVTVAYNLLFESIWGATPGKMLFALKVVTKDSKKLSVMGVFRRFWGKILSLLLIIGYFLPLLTTNSRTMHDIVSGTEVVRVKKLGSVRLCLSVGFIFIFNYPLLSVIIDVPPFR